MKSLINWDRTIFDGEKRLLPSTKVLHTQIHLPELKKVGVLVLNLIFRREIRDIGQ